MKKIWHSPIGAAVLLAGVMMTGQAEAKTETGSAFSAGAAFRSAVQRAQASLTAGDVTGAGGLIASLNAMTPFEKYLKASLSMELAVKRNDVVAQRKAIADMLESGAAPQAQIGHLNYVSGYLSYQTGAIDNAVVYLTRARELGVTDPKAALLLVESYVRQRKFDDAAQLLDQTIAQQKQAGQAVAPSWYDRATTIALARRDWGAVARYNSARLIGAPISAPVWRSALAVYMENARPDKEAQLDLYRLQAATGALASERDYQGYAALAAAQGYAAEAKSVLDAGISGGQLQRNDPIAAPLIKTVTPRAVTYLASVKALPGKAAGAASAAKAEQDGDRLLANSQFADAVPYYRAALDKGTADKDRTATRLGIALARSGDFAGARTALAQVTGTGPWSQIATFWSAWVDVRGADAQAALAQPKPGGA